MSLSIIIPTVGRASVVGTFESAAAQIEPEDEILVYRNEKAWGDAARQSMMERAKGDHLLFMDDDDMYVHGALDIVKAAISTAPERIHMFRMQYGNGAVLWRTQEVIYGNVGTPMIVVPNLPGRVGTWRNPDGYGNYGADFTFIATTCQRGGFPIFHTDVIARIRPHEGEQ